MRYLGSSAFGFLLLAASSSALAQTNVSAQSASISAAGQTVVASRVPVQIGTGAPSYFDVTITLTPTGSETAITGFTVSGTSTPSKTLQTKGFVAGTYVDAGGHSYTVSGPGVGPGGATAWSLTASSSSGSGALISAIWYTAIGSANPEYPRVKAAKINPNSGYSFGVSGGVVNGSTFYNDGALIGAAQTGNGIAISSFTYDGTDMSSPTATIGLTPVN